MTPALPRRRRVALLVLSALAGLVLASSRELVAYWAGGDTRTGAIGEADRLQPPGRPDATVSGSDVTLRWDGASTAAGASAGAYRVQRHDPTGRPVAVGTGCDGAVEALRCTETAVPDGVWSYTIVPVLGLWTGPASRPSAAVQVGATQIAVVAAPITAVAGTRSDLVTIERRDASGAPASAGILSLTLTSDSPSLSFHTVDGTRLDDTQLTLPPGKSRVSFRVEDTRAADVTVRIDGPLGTLTHTLQIRAAAPAALVFVTQPSSVRAGAVMVRAPVVRVEDAFANPVTEGDVGVEVVVETAPDAAPTRAALAGRTTVTSVGGLATFDGLSIPRVGHDYRLRATSGSLAAAVSNPFAVSVGAPARLALVTQPADGVAGSPLTVAARVEDAYGNPDITSTARVEVAIADGPEGATLTGRSTSDASAGMVSFTGLVLERAGAGYQLAVTSPGLEPVSTSPFTIRPGLPAKLAFTVQPPRTVPAGAALEPAVTVEIRDAFANRTADTAEVTLTPAATPGAIPVGTGATGVLVRTATNGLVSFPAMSFARAGEHRLTATSPGLASATTDPFTVTHGPAAALVLTQQPPPSVSAGAPFTVTVQIVDAGGNLVSTGPSSTADVSLTIGTGPAVRTLAAQTPLPASGGVARFTDVSLIRAATGYTLVASAVGLSTTTAAFDVVAGAPARLEIVTQPGSVRAKTPITPALAVRTVDSFSNPVPAAVTVQVALGANPGAAKLSGVVARPSAAGAVTFADLTIDKPATGYTLVATAPGLEAVATVPFVVTAGPATGITWSATSVALMGCTGVGTPIVSGCASAPVGNKGSLTASLTMVDSSGNPVANTGAPITIALTGFRGTLSTATVTVPTGAAISSPFTFTRSPGNGTATVTAAAASARATVTVVFSTHPTGGPCGDDDRDRDHEPHDNDSEHGADDSGKCHAH